MTDIIREKAPLILAEIKKARRILLHCHPNPDPDSFGSALAMWHFLKSLGKNSIIIGGDSEIPQTAIGLPGAENIQPENYFDIHPSDFDLFIILDSSSPGQISRLGKVTFPESLKTIVIDHHSLNENLADISLVEPGYPATGQILYDLFGLWKVRISPEMAVCLFLAIYTDTGGFKYPLTDKNTFLAAADLAEINPGFPATVFGYENSWAPENLEYLRLALNLVNYYFSGKVAVSAVPNPELVKKNIRRTHTENMEIANYLKMVIGCEIGVSFTEIEPGIINLSFRTRDPGKYDVARIAQSTGMGGGHPAAAGATFKMSFADGLKFLLLKIRETYPDLGDP